MFSFFGKNEPNPTQPQSTPGATPPNGYAQGYVQNGYQPPYAPQDGYAQGTPPPPNPYPQGGYAPNAYPQGNNPYAAPPGAFPVAAPQGIEPTPAPTYAPPQAPLGQGMYPPQGQPYPPYGQGYGAPPQGVPQGTVPMQPAASQGKNQFKIALRRLILIAFALVFLFWTVMTVCGFRYRTYDQGGMTVRIYGRFTDDGYTAAKHYYSDGTRAKWDADTQIWEFSDGSVFSGTLREGFFVTGTLTTADFIYSGTFANGNLPNGQGVLSFADTTRYQGAFLDGVFHGHGKLSYPDGSYYVGEFAHGKREGFGTLYSASGAILQEGRYEQDCLVPVVAVPTP